jgi:chitosanase
MEIEKKHIIFLSLLVLLSGCKNDNSNVSNSSNGIVFSKKQRVIADQIISVFENNTPEIQYGYAENINDGRGITAGRAGFTSSTGDMLEVVKRYTELRPGNSLAIYLQRLTELADEQSDSTSGLEGLEYAWQNSANDKVFRDVQDEVVDEEYYDPAVEHCKELGIVLPLSLLNLYDACIQHGDGIDPDGLPTIISRTNNNVGGTPKSGTDELTWLREFMKIRISVLLNPYNEATQDEWAESIGRVNILIEICNSGNVMLTPPININPWGTEYIIPVE